MTAEGPPPVSGSDPPVADAPRHPGLLFAIAPVAVFVLALAVFELAGHGLGDDTPSAAATTMDRAGPDEVKARLLWAASVMIFYVAVAAAILGSAALLRAHLVRGRRRRYAVVGALLVVAALAHLAISGATRNAFSALYFHTFEHLHACACIDPAALARIVRMEVAVNVLAGVTPMLVLLATCAVLEPTAVEGARALRAIQDQMRRLKRLLNLASALLVAGMLNMVLWARWPGALPVDALSRDAATIFADAVTFYWGTVFTLITVSLYVPASMELNRRAEAALSLNPDAMGGARDSAEWLERHGLSLTPTQQLPQVVAMLAPMLAGSFGSSFATLPGTLAGG